MAAGTKNIIVKFIGDAVGLTKTANNSEKTLKGFGDRAGRAIGGLSKTLAVTGAAFAGVAAVAGVGFLKGAVDEFREAEKIGRLTNQVIKSTGGAAGITSKQVGDLAERLSNLAGVDDDLVQAGENVLLTFTNVRNAAGKGNDVFNRATGLALDMSTALGTDLQGSVIQLGKALNDPIKGITALSRVGVSFTAEQKKQIEGFVKSGNLMGAQKVILGELTKEFGGAAAAAADPAQKAQVAWGNFKESLGGLVFPVVVKLAEIFTSKVLPAVRRFIEFFKSDVVPRLREIGATVRETVLPRLVELGRNLRALLLPILEKVGRFVQSVVLPALKTLGEFLLNQVIPAISGLASWLAKNQDVLLALGIAIAAIIVPSFISWAIAAGTAALATIAAIAPVLAVIAVIALLAFGIIQLVKHWDTVWGKIKGIGLAIAGWFAGPFVNFFKSAWDKILGAAKAVWNWLKSNWPYLLGILLGPIALAAAAIYRNWDRIKAGASAVKDWIVDRFNSLVGFMKGLGGRISGAWSGMFDGIKHAFRAAVNWVIDKWNNFSIPGVNTHIRGIGTVGGFSTPDIRRLATGGPAFANRTYLVGERGPELLRMGAQSGTVLPNHALGGPEVLELHLDLGEGIRQVVQISLRERDRQTRRRVLAGVTR